MAKDFVMQHATTDELVTSRALQEISMALEEHGKCLSEFGLPQPQLLCTEVLHELLKWGPDSETLLNCAQQACSQMSAEQISIYEKITQAASQNMPLFVFVDEKAGRGKTFLMNAICNHLRASGRIVLPTATSAFATQLYPGGRTTHSTFKVPVNENNEMLISSIQPGMPHAGLIKTASLIIWDEAPMADRAVLSCVDDVCRQIMACDAPFGGKVVVLLGDFRQTCPVIPGGSRAQIVDVSIRSAPQWDHITVLRLTIPIRNAKDPDFANFVDSIGDGAGPEVNLNIIPSVTTTEDLLNHVFPADILREPAACLKRAILCPTNRQVDSYNAIALNRLQTNSTSYLAADSLKEASEAGVIPPLSMLDFVASHTPPGLPPHSLTIRIGGVYRLMRNFSIDQGLVKNCRVVVIAAGHRLITVRIIHDLSTAGDASDDILIPRITFSSALHSAHTLMRCQFPLAPAYATTFNSCQGLTLNAVGVDLTRPVFSHGQLYTVLSCIRHWDHARILLPKGSNTAANVTFNEILL